MYVREICTRLEKSWRLRPSFWSCVQSLRVDSGSTETSCWYSMNSIGSMWATSANFSSVSRTAGNFTLLLKMRETYS